jgi:uncharacterized membrane protein YfcA
MTGTTILLLFCLGCFGGVMSGLLGIGGGVIYVIVFQNVLQTHLPIAADGSEIVRLTLLNSIFAVFFSALSGSYQQYKIGNFFIKEVLYAAIPAIIFAIAGTAFISNWEGYNRDIFLVIFTLMLFPLMFRFFAKKHIDVVNHISINKYAIGGVMAGLTTAFTGLGGGIVMSPYLHGIHKLSLKKTLSIALGNMLFSTFFILLYKILTHDNTYENIKGMMYGIYFPMVLPVTLGNMLFSPLGVRWNTKSTDQVLRIIFMIFISMIICHNLYGIFVH